MSKKTLLIDFDGTLSQYTIPYKLAKAQEDAEGRILEEPVPGAIDALQAYCRRFQVVIFSTRCGSAGGAERIRMWLSAKGLPEEVLCQLQFTNVKVPAWMILDDRAQQFTGAFPSPDEIDDFVPWNRSKT